MPAFADIKDFLAHETLTHFIAEHHHDVLSLKRSATVGEAMKLLAKHKVQSAPVIDDDGEYVGCVSASDLLKALTTTCEVNLGVHYADECDKIEASEFDGIGKFFVERPLASIIHDADLWMKGDKSTTLMNLLVEGFHVREQKVHHRVFVCDPAKAHAASTKGGTTVVNIKAGTEKEGASAWLPTDVVAQSDMVALLHEHKSKLMPELNMTIEELGLGEGAVFCVDCDTPALAAVHHMAADHKSCVGLTDGKSGKLVGKLSVSDLRGLPAQHFAVLLLPVAELVAILHGKGPSVEEAVGGKRLEAGEAVKLLKDVPIVTAKPGDTFGKVLETVVKNKLHRIFVVDEEGKPASIITLTDILRCIVSDAH